MVPSGWRLFLIVGGLSIFGPLCIDMYLPALPAISANLHASASAAQTTLTACLVGISAGQLLIGPVSDRLGRRRPLLAGLGLFVVSSVACAMSSDIYLLAAFRLLEGLGGAAGIVISRSIVRDLHSGVALVRFFSTLMLVTGLGPVLAPQIGGAVLSFMSWRGVFGLLAAMGLVLLVVAWWRVPETLPPVRRSTGTVWSAFVTMIGVARDRVFLGYALACGLGMGATFAYISGSSFVLQNIYGLSPTVYGAVFALNACGLIAGAQINGRVAAKVPSTTTLTGGLLTMIVGGGVLILVVVSRMAGLALVIPALLVFMLGWGFVGPSALALGLDRYPNASGAASAVLGSAQFLMASLMAPVAGIGGSADAFPMALLMLLLPIAALLVRVAMRPGERSASAASLASAPSVAIVE